MFPQFATGPLPRHGLLRTRRWSLVSHTGSSATLRITDDDETRALWPHPFIADLAVELTETLAISLTITNSGDSPLPFTAALHNYFAVSDVRVAAVHGLSGLTFIDKMAAGAHKVEEARTLCVDDQTDRIYMAGPRQVTIEGAIATSSTAITAEGFGDWVVWNPWIDGSASLADMRPEDYLHMLCVEAARIADPMVLAPGAAWCGREILGVT